MTRRETLIRRAAEQRWIRQAFFALAQIELPAPASRPVRKSNLIVLKIRTPSEKTNVNRLPI